MSNKEKYKSAFSHVRTTVRIEMEDFEKMRPVHRSGRKSVAVAAIVCLIVAFSATAYAMNLFGLKDLVLKKEEIKTVDNNTAIAEETTVPQEMISLQGFSDSKEYKAVAEWITFRDSYDQDGAILSKIGNGPTGLDDKYNLYSVYTQEMVDKLEEIVKKYDLKLHRNIEFDINTQELCSKAGIGDFLGTANTPESIYLYEDGTFHIDGYAVLDNRMKINYQFMNCIKGSFTDVILNIGSMADYQEWTYTTSEGISLSLSISPQKALVIANLDNSFVTINVLTMPPFGEPGQIKASDLEQFAETFDFSALN